MKKVVKKEESFEISHKECQSDSCYMGISQKGEIFLLQKQKGYNWINIQDIEHSIPNGEHNYNGGYVTVNLALEKALDGDLFDVHSIYQFPSFYEMAEALVYDKLDI